MSDDVLEAVKDTSKDTGDGWILWRCPRCNCWDWALQGPPGATKPGIYRCDECSLQFRVPEVPPP